MPETKLFALLTPSADWDFQQLHGDKSATVNIAAGCVTTWVFARLSSFDTYAPLGVTPLLLQLLKRWQHSQNSTFRHNAFSTAVTKVIWGYEQKGRSDKRKQKTNCKQQMWRFGYFNITEYMFVQYTILHVFTQGFHPFITEGCYRALLCPPSLPNTPFAECIFNLTPWSESASELYRPSDRRFSAKWLPTFAD
jgi:hypothetical protein